MMLSKATGTGPGAWLPNLRGEVRSITSKVTGTGGNMVVAIQGSYDQVAVVKLGEMNPLLATDDGITIQCAYDWIRANVTTATAGVLDVEIGS
jgi:hypothetical protein